MTKQVKYVTKSIRLTEDEARELAELVADQPASESALIRQWVLRSMRQERIEQAVAAYQHDEVDLREGAAMAGIPIGVFVDELAAKHIAMLRDPSLFQKELEDLLSEFGGPDAWAAAREALAPDDAPSHAG